MENRNNTASADCRFCGQNPISEHSHNLCESCEENAADYLDDEACLFAAAADGLTLARLVCDLCHAGEEETRGNITWTITYEQRWQLLGEAQAFIAKAEGRL